MTSRERRDPYIVLGVPRQASGEEIARAYNVRRARVIQTAAPDRRSGSRRSVMPMTCCATHDAVRCLTGRIRWPGRGLLVRGEGLCATRCRARSTWC
jgi:hypothetical protein